MGEETAWKANEKWKRETDEPLDPCREAQADGAPCDCARSDCQTCGKGVPHED